MSFEEILEDFPYLEKEDILACLSYAANKEKIEFCAWWNYYSIKTYLPGS